MANTGEKRYGLIKANKPTPGTFVPRPSIFGEDSDSDDDVAQQGGSDWVKKAFQKESEKITVKRQTKLNMQRALDEDPTIYQYDEVYEKIEEKKVESKLARKDIEKKPKYITALLLQAERRKHENERRTERQVQKEREAEGEEFKDKEAFVTAAYRAKLEEFKKQDEEEHYREQLEAFTDVSKQKDLSGFYRHLYRQTVVGEEVPDRLSVKQEPTENIPEPAENAVCDDPSEEKQKEKTERLYRKRRSSSSSSSSSGSKQNPDADSDLTDSSSSNSNEETEKKPAKKEDEQEGSSKAKSKKIDTDNTATGNDITLKNPSVCDKNNKESRPSLDVNIKEENDEIDALETKPKINIWLKRTVADVFDAALERYYIRKAARSQSSC